MNNAITPQELASAKSGNEITLAAIIARYIGKIRYMARRAVAPGLDFDDAVQEGLIGLFFAIRCYNEISEASFNTYASTCICNAITSAQRAAGRKKHSPLNYSVPIPVQQSIPGPEEATIVNESLNLALEKAQKQLSTLEHEVFHLKLRGFSINEIASRLGRTPKTIDNALVRLRNKLKS